MGETPEAACQCEVEHPRRRFLRTGAAAVGALAVAPAVLGGQRTAPPPATSLEGLRLVAATVPAPRVVTRAEWGADERLRKGSPGFAPTTRLVVHHTVTSNTDPDPAATVRAVYRQHVATNGWSDVGYNFLIDHGGRVYEGRWAQAYGAGGVHHGEDARGFGVIGAHTEGYNTGAVGVALLGTYEYGGRPTAAALDALVGVLAWKASAHRIDPLGRPTVQKADESERRTVDAIAGHRDYKLTACPGKDLHALLPDIRERVRRRLLAGLVGYRVLAVGRLAQPVRRRRADR
jgi:hypothetical protein